MPPSPLFVVEPLVPCLIFSRLSDTAEFDKYDAQGTKLQEETAQFRDLGFCNDNSSLRSILEQRELNRIPKSSGSYQCRIASCQRHFHVADAVYNFLGEITLPLATYTEF